MFILPFPALRRDLPALLPLSFTLLLMPIHPAVAQRLDLNQGSALIINDGVQSGTFLSSTNYAFSGGASPATYSYKVINMATFDGTSVLTLSTGSSVTTLYDFYSGTTNVNGGQVGTFNNSGVTVNLTDGSVTSLSGGGYVNVSGGTLGTVTDEFQVSVTGGTVNDLRSGGNAYVSGGQVNTLLNGGGSGVAFISGGQVGVLTDSDAANTTITGGTVTTINSDPFYGITRTITINGGTIGAVDNAYNGTLILNGGSIGSVTNEKGSPFDPFMSPGSFQASGGSVGTLNNYGLTRITGGQFTFLDNFQRGVINVYGLGLSLSGGFVTGLLQDGESINAAYQDDGGVLNLFNTGAVPEASTTASFGLLLALGMGGVAIAAKRKKQIA